MNKSDLRTEARARRAALAAAMPDFAQRLAGHADALAIAPGAIVAAYVAVKDEADPSALLRALEARGAIGALPRVVAKGGMLSFHADTPGQEMALSAFGILEPHAHWPRLLPRILLVPLLAFDAKGHRLGYGGGYYDRTLGELSKAEAPPRVIGVAYAGQEVEALPREPHDHPLDAVLTENGLRVF